MLNLQGDNLEEYRYILHTFDLENQSLLIVTLRKIFNESNFKENRVFATPRQIQLECEIYVSNFHWMIRIHTKRMP